MGMGERTGMEIKGIEKFHSTSQLPHVSMSQFHITGQLFPNNYNTPLLDLADNLWIQDAYEVYEKLAFSPYPGGTSQT